MKTEVRVATQVAEFVQSLAPDPRRCLRQAIKGLARGQGDIKRLEGNLAGYSRLGVAGCRVIFQERSERGVRIIDCIFAERRAMVYEIFVRLLAEQTLN
jgi:mRNA-degrading endonuclease RelE of RelBE toxin-antitoxin system